MDSGLNTLACARRTIMPAQGQGGGGVGGWFDIIHALYNVNLSNGSRDLVRVLVRVQACASVSGVSCLYPREHIDLCMYTSRGVARTRNVYYVHIHLSSVVYCRGGGGVGRSSRISIIRHDTIARMHKRVAKIQRTSTTPIHSACNHSGNKPARVRERIRIVSWELI